MSQHGGKDASNGAAANVCAVDAVAWDKMLHAIQAAKDVSMAAPVEDRHRGKYDGRRAPGRAGDKLHGLKTRRERDRYAQGQRYNASGLLPSQRSSKLRWAPCINGLSNLNISLQRKRESNLYEVISHLLGRGKLQATGTQCA